MLLPIAYYGAPILRKKTQPIQNIEESIHQLVKDMHETMLTNNGWALAAPQVFHPISLFISFIPRKEEGGKYSQPEKIKVYINPKILWVSEEIMTIEDGCVSIPRLRGVVSRPYRIKIEATDLQGNRFEEELWDYEAFGAMHENDHLNGVLFIDRMKDKKERRLLEPKLLEVKKKYYKE